MAAKSQLKLNRLKYSQEERQCNDATLCTIFLCMSNGSTETIYFTKQILWNFYSKMNF